MAPLGNLIRLLPLQLDELPYHPHLHDQISGSITGSEALDRNELPNLTAFIQEVLDHGMEFINDTLPSTFQKGNLRPSPPSTAPVRHLRRDISSAELGQISWSTPRIPRQPTEDSLKAGEAWFVRKSRHANQSQEGTADFGELDYAVRRDHSEHEREATPDIFDSYKVLEWDFANEDGLTVGDYSQIKMTSR